MTPHSHRLVALLAALLAGLALASAVASEWYGELVPCALCLVQRWPYRIIIALGLIAAFANRRWGMALIGLAALVFFADAVVAFIHVGVEQKFWPSPLPECMAPNLGGGSIADRLARMPLLPSKPCEDPTFLIPGLPISMAAMNMIYALITGSGFACWTWRKWRGRTA